MRTQKVLSLRKFIFIFLFLVSAVAQAQVDITVGTGTAVNTGGTNTVTDYPCPLQDFYEGSRTQYLYRVADLKAAGMDSGKIYSISFNVTALNAFTGTLDSLRIKIGTTTDAALTATTWASFASQDVYGPDNYIPTVGKNTLVFNTPFDWNGTSNLIVEICSGDPANTSAVYYTQNVSITQSTTAYNSSHTYIADNLGSLCNTATITNTGTQTKRPNIIFSWMPKLACTSSPNVGTASSTAATVCFGQSFTLTATGLTVANGIEYQWQSSTTGSSFSDIAGATTSSFATSQASTNYYRLKTTCTNSAISVYSNVVLVTTPALMGGTYTIDKTSPASSNNFQSFNAAYTAMKCGIISPVVLNVVPNTGPYNEQLIINGKIPNSSATNTITINGNANIIFYSATTTTERAIIKLKGAKYFVFDSLNVSATAGTYGFGFHLMNDADSNVIRKCSILSSTSSTTTNYAGIAISALDNNAVGLGNTLCDGNLIENNTITGGYYGITQVANFAGGVNLLNVIQNNTIKDFYRYGIYVNGSYNSVIKMNKISRPTRTAVGPFDGIYFTGQSNSDSVIQNRIHSPFAVATNTNQAFIGINFDIASASATYDNLVINNAIYGIVSTGSQVGFNNTASSNIWYLHNTISLDDVLSTATTITKGFLQAGTAVSLVNYNNLISISRGGTGIKHCISITAPTVFTGSDNNNFSMDATAGNNYIGAVGAANKQTLIAWQTTTGLDAASLSVQPGYFNPKPTTDTSDYHPTNMAMNDKGLSVGISNDIVGNARDFSTPDIGAYEYTPPPCTPASLNGTTTININNKIILIDTTVCQNTDVKLDVNIVGGYGSTQTFQWQRVSDTTQAAQAFLPLLTHPDTTFKTGNASYYYRCKISCSGSNYFTNWRRVNVITALPSAVYTINSTVPTNYINGVAGGNFASFNEANNGMKTCGVTGSVTFNVVPLTGPYLEQLKIDSIAGATASSQVYFKGNGNTITYPTGNPSSTTERAVIKLSRADFINFDSLTIDASTATTTYAYGVQLLNNADSNTFTNCTIISNTTTTGTSLAGIVINGGDSTSPTSITGAALCDGNVFDKNTIRGGGYGISLIGSSSSPINGNIVRNNTLFDYYYEAIRCVNTYNSKVLANFISSPNKLNSGSTCAGITANSNSKIEISGNRITNFFVSTPTHSGYIYGINLSNLSGDTANINLVTNNQIHHLLTTGAVNAIYSTTSSYVNILHNTILLDNICTGTSLISNAYYEVGNHTNIVFKNNNIALVNKGFMAKYAINLSSSSLTGLISNNNNFYISSTVTNGYVANLAGSNRKLLLDWQNSMSPKQDSLSYSYDPLFTDTTTGNLKPQFYVLNNKGDNTVGITTDILGITRNASTPDIGAYEFDAVACTSTLFAGSATITPSTGNCLGLPISLNLTGNSPIGSINFQWQDSAAGGNWQNLGSLRYTPQFDTVTTPRNFYRCIVTCAASGAFALSTIATKDVSGAMPAGVYTIDSATATNYTGVAGQNFNTFTEAVASMQCGIRGSVVFNVKKGTYNEQIRIPNIPGASASSTINFQSFSGVVSDVKITVPNVTIAANYILSYDSAQFVTFKNISLVNQGPTLGIVVNFKGTATNCKLLNCNISSPKVFSAIATNNAAIFTATANLNNITIKGNTITNGGYGIYFTGQTPTLLTGTENLIDSNFISGSYGSALQVSNTKKITVSRNQILLNNATLNSAGIYAGVCDSGMIITSNKIYLSNSASATTYGISLGLNIFYTGFGEVSNNEIYANTGNTGKIIGLSALINNGLIIKSNVITINNAGVGSIGLQHNHNNNSNPTTVFYYNNSVHISTNDTTATAANISQIMSGNIKLFNNIFSNTGTGKSLIIANTSTLANVVSNYNMLFTNGNYLAAIATTNYQSISQLQVASSQDKNSIVYQPSFVSNTDLHPNLTDPNAWAMNGRGIHIKGNTKDADGNYRPDSLTAGVPDIGAYEFTPTVAPNPLTAIPASPASNTTQIFYLGSDTVMRIKWNATAPSSIAVKRYSGVAPPNINNPARVDSMFFYTKIDVPAGSNYNCDVQLNYLSSWLGSIPSKANEYQLGLGQTNGAGNWVVGVSSSNSIATKTISQSSVSYLDKLTGLFNQYSPPQPVNAPGTSNAGTNFWVAYPITSVGVTETYQLYLSATKAATVTVSIPCLGWTRTYNIAANAVLVSDVLPTAAKSTIAGKSCNGINIISDVDIVAYTHCFGSASSGASMLLPTNVWGYEYRMLGLTQVYGGGNFSFYYVVAQHDSTKVIVNNTVAVQSPTKTNDTIILNKGEWYQVLANSQTEELSGSTIKSVDNGFGKCYPIAVYSGSSRTQNAIPCGSGGDFIMQQNFPASAWGKKYLTAPTSANTGITTLQGNLFRISLKDINTNVLINGTQIYPIIPATLPTGIFNLTYNSTGQFIEFTSNTGSATSVTASTTNANYILADKPITVAQYLGGACGSAEGDPEMFYLTPLEQSVTSATFYRNSLQGINTNLVTVIGSTSSAPKISEDGVPTIWPYFYPHPNYPGKTVYVKSWTAAQKQVNIYGDSAFTGITYGLGSVESYGYNIGTLVRTLSSAVKTSTGDSTSLIATTCAGKPFQISTSVPVLPDSINWQLNTIPNIHPSAAITLKKPYSPAPVMSVKANGDTLYKFTLPATYTVDSGGYYAYTVTFWHQDVEGCDKSVTSQQYVQVLPTLVINNVSYNNPVTIGNTLTLNVVGDNISFYSWTGPNGFVSSQASPNIPNATPANAGKYYVTVSNGTCSKTDSITVNIIAIGSFTIDGRVITANKKLVNTAKVTLNSTYQISTLSQANGSYNFGSLAAGNYILKPAKNNDVKKNNGVSSIDVIVVQNHILNKAKLNSAYKIIAADVNNNKTVTNIDIIFMKRLILGVDTTFTGNRLWAFVDSSATFADTTNPFPYKDSISLPSLSGSKINQTFIGVKLGDVNYDWNPALARGTSVSDVELLISNSKKQSTLQESEISNNKLEIPIAVKNFKDLTALQYTLHFDNSKYEFVAIRNNKLAIEYNAQQANKTGNISFLWADAKGEEKTLEDGSEIFTLVLKSKWGKVNSEWDSRNLEFGINNDITEIEAWDKNNQQHNIILSNKETPIYHLPFTIHNWSVSPNPTNGEVAISFLSNNNKNIQFELSNVVGKTLYTQSFEAIKGSNIFYLNLKKESKLPTGLYFLKAKGLEGEAVKRIIINGN